jgi:formate/nitrite transporter FocA (FNT family)
MAFHATSLSTFASPSPRAGGLSAGASGVGAGAVTGSAGHDPSSYAERSAEAVATAAIDAERERLARSTRRGIGMPIAGMLYWIAVAVLVRELPVRTAMLATFFATGMVFPVGFLITKLLGGDLFAKSERFTSLGMLFNAAQLFFWPIIVVVYRSAPEWTPFAMAVLFGSHFLGYAWLYRSRGYAFLTVGTMVVLCTAVLVAGDPLFTDVPLLTAAVYAGAVGLLFAETRAAG